MDNRAAGASERALVFELGVEELPARYFYALLQALREAVGQALTEARLAARDLRVLGTPRRLVVRAWLEERQAPRTVRIRGPRVQAAFREGEPTPALLGFLRRTGVPLEAVQEDGEGYLTVEREEARLPAAEVLPGALAQAVEALPLPRSMRWGVHDARFLRPVRWLLLVWGDRVLPMEAFGVQAGEWTYGNRTDHPERIRVSTADEYDQALAAGRVMLDPDERRRQIAETARRLAGEVGAAVMDDPDLLDEVAALVEWPTPFLGRFDERFLAVPDAILVTSMKVHQRYFPLQAQGRLVAGFIGVRNGQGRDLEAVRHGNQKVLRARLEDAWFFYHEDLKHPLAAYRPRLDGIVFHAKLGTMGDKVRRLQAMVEAVAPWAGLPSAELDALREAVALCKCDLLTHVVGEFPELQGVMGGIYAARQGYPAVVAAAVGEHYRPAFAGDAIPSHPVGQWLALLDRLDTLVGAEATGIRVSGSEDPFGLRRAALGAARIVCEGALPPTVTLAAVARAAGAGFVGGAAAVEAVVRLAGQRLQAYLEEARGWPPAWAQALVEAAAPWQSLHARYQFFRPLAEGSAEAVARVAEAFRRADRLWDRAVAPLWEPPTGLTGAEAGFAAALAAARVAMVPDWPRWWTVAQDLVDPLHAFFTAVLVNDPDPALRRRRMGLVAAARAFLAYPLEWTYLA